MCSEHGADCPSHPGSCSGGANSGASSSGGTYSSDPLVNSAGTIGNAIGTSIGQALGQAMFGPKKTQPSSTPSEDWTKQQQELERQRRKEREAEAARAEEERRRREKEQTDAAKADLLGQMRGVDQSAHAVDFPAVKTPGDMEFKAYHAREQEAEKAPDTLTRKLTKPQEDWCKMNRPLYPTQPIQPIPDDEYEDMKYRYSLRKAEWDSKCLGAASGWGPAEASAAAPAPAPAASPVAPNKMPKQLSEFKTVGGTDGSATLKGPPPPRPSAGGGEADSGEAGSGFDSAGPLRDKKR